MKYYVSVTFDLVNGSREDYEGAYAILAAHGFKSVGEQTGRPTVKLTTTMIKLAEGSSAEMVCQTVENGIIAAFQRKRFKADLAVMVGEAFSLTRIPDDLIAPAPLPAPGRGAPRI